jgi:DNA-directed RNA polymerase subunit RPC12/RpoP
MASKLVCAAEYLSYQEGILLYNNLAEAGISALVKTCGPPSIPFGEGQFYQLLVAEVDMPQAREISEKFEAELIRVKSLNKCPRCRSEAVFKPVTLPFWQKLYYAGTEVYKCESCGKKFSK